ncbi:MAG: ATP-binding protein [Chloroflexi bacterium]|nr:ATP-binding protein [Chloroflexota bacterium]MCL5074442.1 ATP-binding protein [Chloroflexota bacterium]
MSGNPSPDQRERLGIVVAGSLSEGLEARLDADCSVEDMAVGRYVVIDGEKRKFFGMITDVMLEASSPQIAMSPPDVSDPFIADVLAGTSTFGALKIAPMLTIGHDAFSQMMGPQPVKTIPSHFSQVKQATAEDVAAVFGQEDDRHFHIGTPLDMETKVCLDLKRLVERSSGVFGKSGTGKTFLTRLLLTGIAQKRVAVNLVFDMHNEYGWQGTMEGGRYVKGLKQLFGVHVAIFALDEKSARDRGVMPDFVVEIGYDQIEPNDVLMLRETLELTEAQIESIHRLARIYGESRWFEAFIEMDGSERDALAKEVGLNPGTLQVLHRKMDTRLARLPFLKKKVMDDSVQRIMECLARGVHVVLEFGRHRNLDAYILVANILTRRIHERYVEQKERAMGEKELEPTPLVITIEEAHKFLNPQVAGQTIFGTIAREMRKYNVTLLIVDQRPSGIADEVMSQIGTRVTYLLDDDKDISAVLTGVSGAQLLRTVLAKLDSRQQALILGHAVPMPVVIRTRDYGTPESYAELQFVEGARLLERARQDIEDLFGK